MMHGRGALPPQGIPRPRYANKQKTQNNNLTPPAGRNTKAANIMRYDDFLKFEKIVESCGWSHFDSNFVQDKKGHYWCRYNMEKCSANAVPFAELQMRLKAATKKENVDFGTCCYRSAPEIVHPIIIVKETARFKVA